MTRIALLVAVFVGLSAVPAGAVPSTIAFTGRLKTSAGVVTGSVDLTFKIFSAATGGTPLWTETHPGINADNGLVYVELGSLTTLDTTILDGNPAFLEITVGTETLSPRLSIDSVPYAIRTGLADEANTLGGTISSTDVVTAVAASPGLTATKAGNTVSIGLAACSAGQVLKFNGASWACAAEATYTGGNGIAINGTTVSLATAGCTAGQVYKFNGSSWACAPDDNTIYTAGTGIAVSGTAISLSTAGCAAGSVWKFNGTTFACTAEQTYSAGTGLTLTSNVFAVDTNAIQARVTGTCPAGSAIGSIAANGTVTCDSHPSGTYVTVVASASVAVNSFQFLGVSCPSGETATGGGEDSGNVFTDTVTSSGPTFNGTRLLSMGAGTFGAPNGWIAGMANHDTVAENLMIAVICTK